MRIIAVMGKYKYFMGRFPGPDLEGIAAGREDVGDRRAGRRWTLKNR
jgi:hypothetical protein